MAKDPAFLFYPNDWIGGTMGMTFEEKGAYMELLMTQFNRGHMTTHMIGQVVGQVFDKIQDKFKKDEYGLWYNERLEEEKLKRQNYTKSRRNNVSGKNQHAKNEEKIEEKNAGHMVGHMTSHMENENKNINTCIKDINTVKENKDSNGWQKEKGLFKNDEVYRMNICQKLRINKSEVDEKLLEFLDRIEITEDYKSVKELKKHFMNWIQKNTNQKSIKIQKNNYVPFTPREDW